jgi:peptide/nickel transport system substrate-binding protein
VQQARTASGDAQATALKDLNRYLVDQAWFAPWDAAEGTFITTQDVAVTAVPGVSVPPLTDLEPAGS